MPISADEVLPLATAIEESLSQLSVKERAQDPSEHFLENYNRVLDLAQEAKPDVDKRLWPKHVEAKKVPSGPVYSEASYAEILSYTKQIISLLAVEPPMPSMG